MLRSIYSIRNQIFKEAFKNIIRNQTRSLSIVNFRRNYQEKETPILKKSIIRSWKLDTRRNFSDLPKHQKITMPALSPTMESGNIISWAKKEGDRIADGDLLAEIETDKSVMPLEANEDGFMAKIIVPAGTKGVAFGTLICITVSSAEHVTAFKGFTAPAARAPAAPPPAAGAPAAPRPAAPTPSPGPPTPSAADDSKLPAHTKVPLPSLSPTMEAGAIVSWSKKEGDELQDGDMLVEIETDKATIPFETPETGFLAKIIVPAGTKKLNVGELICIIVKRAEDVAAFKSYTTVAPDAARPTAAGPSQKVLVPPPPPRKSSDSPKQDRPKDSVEKPPAQKGAETRVFASPLARKLAKSENIELQGTGSGIFGSIKSADLQAMRGADALKPRLTKKSKDTVMSDEEEFFRKPDVPYIDIPISNMRSVIARRLYESKSKIPHFYLSTDIKIDELLRVKNHLNKHLKSRKLGLTVNDFVVKSVAMACTRMPTMNCAWMETAIRQFTGVDVSIAVATERGLYTPVIFNAHLRGLVGISKLSKSLVTRTRSGQLKPQEMTGGTITVSNLGMFGITHFQAIINPPQAAIIAVGCKTMKLSFKDDRKTVQESAYLTATLSCDHRAIDGDVAAHWLTTFKENMEEPSFMLL